MNTTNLRSGLKAIVGVVQLTLFGMSVNASAEQLAAGMQRRWTLQFRTQLEQPGPSRPAEISLTGDWVVTISAVRSGEYDVALQFVNIRPIDNSTKSVPPEAIEQVRKRLARPFWATYNDGGALLAMHFFNDVTPSDRNLLQMIATETQLVNSEPDRVGWTVLERDGAGSYLALYTRTALSTITKRKLKYIDTDGVPSAPARGLHVGVDQSEWRIFFDSDGEIAAIDGSDRVRIGVGFGDSGQLLTLTELHMNNLRKSKAPELIASLEHARAEIESVPIVTHQPDQNEVRAQRDERLLEGHTTESLLKAAMAGSVDDKFLSARLAALFRRRPEAIQAALNLLRTNGTQKRITSALASAGSSAAIDALGKIAYDPAAHDELRIDALTALVLIEHPRAQAMYLPLALLDSHDRIASAARMVAGALARAGRTEHPTDADSIDGALISCYRRAREVSELTDVLGALGNSVGPSALPIIEGALRDRRDPVRAAAARALRLASGADVDRLLSETITADADPQVRAAAIFSTSFRHTSSTIADALIQAARRDPAELVRSAAIAQLRAHADVSPNIADTLAWVAEHDPRPSVRRLAREGITSLPGRSILSPP